MGIDPEKLPINPNLARKVASGGATVKEWLGTVFAFVVSILFIIVGVLFREECTAEPMMPYALMASGGLFLLISILEISEEYLCPEGGCRTFNKVLITLLWIAKIAVFVFFVWVVYSKFTIVDYQDEKSPEFCNVWVFFVASLSVVITLLSLLVAYIIVPCCEKFICKSEN